MHSIIKIVCGTILWYKFFKWDCLERKGNVLSLKIKHRPLKSEGVGWRWTTTQTSAKFSRERRGSTLERTPKGAKQLNGNLN